MAPVRVLNPDYYENTVLYRPIGTRSSSETAEPPTFDTSFSYSTGITDTTTGGSDDTRAFGLQGPHALPMEHWSIWAYLAVAFVLFSVTVVVIYAMYRCCQSSVVRISENQRNVEKEERERWRRLRGWRMGSNSEMDYARMHHEDVLKRNAANKYVYREERISSSGSGASSSTFLTNGEGFVPLIKFPPGLMDLPELPGKKVASKKPLTLSGHKNTAATHGRVGDVDTYDIPFARSVKQLWADPKLSPIRGSIVRPKPVKLATR